MKLLGVGNVHLHIVRVGLRFLHFIRYIEGRIEGFVLKSQVYLKWRKSCRSYRYTIE